MKVLQIGKYYPPYRGGIETHVQLLCEQLRPAVDSEVVVAGHAGHAGLSEVNGVPVFRAHPLMSVSGVALCPGMFPAVWRSEADLVHVHHPHPLGLLAYLVAGRRRPLVISYHSDIVRQRLAAGLFRPVLETAMRRAGAVIVATAGYRDSSPILDGHRTRLRIIPYGIRAHPGGPMDPDRVAALRAESGDRLVVAVGRLVYYKGFDYLIRAMAHVDARLIIVGDGPLRKNLEAEATASGVAGRVRFAGNVADVGAYYRAADVFVLPSVERSEAFGIVQLEAMAAKTPVVNTQLPSGVPEVSRHGESGLTVPPRDEAALARAINDLLANPGRRAELGAAGRRRVEAEFSVERMSQRVRRVYEDVLAARTT